ncbi:hypothetical protein DL89DRAFT_270415 [Linderina pennispora]|uniref:Zinc/iron permease n=1 Tax=Linderina pennispora TaxID=61395 RepID=A0A1Y1VXL1_9FUNG|nr:uncharacterized protein DL89DRAFT_270415 [Linderina pennispora]ORX66028.1 hypothetical protein DL89DRAFT_270415 [Linderina pennispora]
MQAVFRLVLEGLAMFAGSWAAGCIPLYVRMEASRFNIIALFGAGLLIGASLAVILPEGGKGGSPDSLIDTINNTIGWSLVAGFSIMFLIDNAFPSHHAHSESDHDQCPTAAPANDSAACLDQIQLSARGANSEYTLHDAGFRSQQPNDALPGRGASPLDSASHDRSSHEWVRPGLDRPWLLRSLPSTLIGILVHSCADGLALGAAVAAASAAVQKKPAVGSPSAVAADDHTSSSRDHCAPAAFGLITTLKQQGYAPYKLSVWLTVFAASAPLAALVTYAVFSIFASPAPGHHSEAHPWTGTIMLFSAGTFMYVAMAHTLAEAIHQAKALRAREKAARQGGSMANVVGSLSLVDIVVLLFGVILPPLVSKDHDD